MSDLYMQGVASPRHATLLELFFRRETSAGPAANRTRDFSSQGPRIATEADLAPFLLPPPRSDQIFKGSAPLAPGPGKLQNLFFFSALLLSYAVFRSDPYCTSSFSPPGPFTCGTAVRWSRRRRCTVPLSFLCRIVDAQRPFAADWFSFSFFSSTSRP